MATLEQRLQIIIDAQNKTDGALSDVSKGLDKFKKNLQSFQPAFKAAAVAGTLAFGAIAGAMTVAVKEAMEAEAAQNRLTQILKTSRGATDEQVNALLRQANALEKVGVVAADSIVQAQAQLATFDLEAESIERLTPAILDYVVAERGASATTEDLRSLTNGLAQALQGNFASLTKTGFILDDATKALIENGTEAERTAALVKVLNSTYKGFNESARKTAEGSLIALRNEFNNLKETVGKQLLPVLQKLIEKVAPVIEKITAWVEKNPELTAKILMVSAAIAGLVAVLGTIGIILPAVITGFQLMLGPIGLVILAVGALVAAGIYLYMHWDTVKAKAIEVWTNVKDTIIWTLQIVKDFFVDTWNNILEFLTNVGYFIIGAVVNLLNILVPNWQEGLFQIYQIVVQIWDQIKAFFLAAGTAIAGVMNTLGGWIKTAWNAIVAVFNWAKEQIKAVLDWFTGAIQPVLDLMDKIINKAKSVASSVASAVGGGVSSLISTGKSFLSGRAIGGPVSVGTPYMVGENGPEVFTPATAGRISSGVGGLTLVLNITGNSFMGREGIADQIGDEIVRALQLRMKLQ